MCRWCKPQNEQASGSIAKRRDGFAPIGPLAKGASFGDGNLAAVVEETRATLASDDVVLHCKYVENDGVSLRISIDRGLQDSE
jgi:hypothetical protein